MKNLAKKIAIGSLAAFISFSNPIGSFSQIGHKRKEKKLLKADHIPGWDISGSLTFQNLSQGDRENYGKQLILPKIAFSKRFSYLGRIQFSAAYDSKTGTIEKNNKDYKSTLHYISARTGLHDLFKSDVGAYTDLYAGIGAEYLKKTEKWRYTDPKTLEVNLKKGSIKNNYLGGYLTLGVNLLKFKMAKQKAMIYGELTAKGVKNLKESSPEWSFPAPEIEVGYRIIPFDK